MSPPFTRRQYSGGAVATTINGGLTNTTATFDVADGTTYPTATFFCVIDESLATEEKVFVAARSGNTFSSVLRGEDGTTALPHSAGAVIRHVFVAQDADEANAVATVLTVQGDILARTATGPGRTPVGTPGAYLRANPSEITGLSWSLQADTLDVTVFDARGDVLVGTGDNAMVRVPAGANGQVLTADTVGFPTTFLGYAYPIATLTTAEIAALTGGALWDGRQVYNTTIEAPLVYNTTAAAWRGVRSFYIGATGTAGTSTATFTEFVTATVTVPDQGCAGTVFLSGRCFLSKTLSSASYMRLRVTDATGTMIGQDRSDLGQSAANHTVTISAADTMTAGAAKTWVLTFQNQAGTGNFSWFADPTLHRLDAIFTPLP